VGGAGYNLGRNKKYRNNDTWVGIRIGMSSPIFHLFTVASDESKLDKLYQTAEWAGIGVEVIQVVKWTGFIDKIICMKEGVDGLADDTIVCFIDAYDVLAMGEASEVVRKFRESGRQILMSSELNCYPAENRPYYDLIEYMTFEEEERAGIWRGPASQAVTTNYKYMNSGGYIGYAGALKRMFQWKSVDEIREICELGGDQNFFTQYYLTFALDPVVNVGLDDKQTVFQNLYKVDLADFAFFGGRLYNHRLRSYPCFVHFNGFKDYGGCLIQEGTGVRREAMTVFMEKMTQSRTMGNAGMDWRLPMLMYAGMRLGCIPQLP